METFDRQIKMATDAKVTEVVLLQPYECTQDGYKNCI